jgi:hypothetical protein
MNAFKLSLILPVGFRDMATMRTFLRRVSGIDICHKAIMGLSLVLEKLFQLIKGPVMELTSLFMPLTTSLKDIFEILKNNCGPNRNGLNYFFRYAMILVPAKTVLLLGQFSKVSFRRPGTTGLEPSSQSLIPMRNSSDSSSTEKLLFGRDSYSSDTPVDPDKDLRTIAWFRIRDEFFKHECEKYSSLIVNQFCGLAFPSPELIEIVIGREFNALDSTLYGKDRDFVFIKPNIVGVLI